MLKVTPVYLVQLCLAVGPATIWPGLDDYPLVDWTGRQTKTNGVAIAIDPVQMVFLK